MPRNVKAELRIAGEVTKSRYSATQEARSNSSKRVSRRRSSSNTTIAFGFMFRAKTDRIEELSRKYPERIAELELLFDKCSNIYIDYANVRPWSEKLKWHIDCHRLRQFFASFSAIKCLKIFHG